MSILDILDMLFKVCVIALMIVVNLYMRSQGNMWKTQSKMNTIVKDWLSELTEEVRKKRIK